MSTPLTFQRLDFEYVRRAFPDRWERAKQGEADIERVDDERWTLEFADGDSHDVLLYEAATGPVGFCDCDGFAYHEDACAHLCRVKMTAELGNMDLPTPPTDLHIPDVGQQPPESETDAADGADRSADVEDVDRADQDAGDREVVATVESGLVQETSGPDPQEIEDPEEFVSEISGVPPAFVVDMGRGADSTPYITKEGLNYIARQQGIETRAEPISPSWEEPDGMAAYRGIAVDEDGRRYEDVGTAHVSGVEDTVGEENLDELASTRATNRALRLATGAGFASMEEVTGEDPVIEADQEVLDDE